MTQAYGEKCKDCGELMKLVKNGKKNPLDENTWIYECWNEDCATQPTLTVKVCEECEHETRWWD